MNASESVMLRRWLQHNIDYIQNIIDKERIVSGCSPVASSLSDQLMVYQNVIFVMDTLGMGKEEEGTT